MEDNFKRIKTSLKIKTCIICNKCPLKLYAEDDSCVEYGKGFLLPKYIFVLPSWKTDESFSPDEDLKYEQISYTYSSYFY